MIEIHTCRTEVDEQLSLEIYNTVWPEQAVTAADVVSFRARTLAYSDQLALVDREPAGSVVAARMAQKPDIGLLILTVLAGHRGRGVGTALYEAGSRFLASHGLAETEAMAADDDEPSLAWAARRGFVEIQRNGGMVLELADVEPPPAEPPAGIEIVTLADRSGLERGLYEVAAESLSDIPGDEDYRIEPFDAWLAAHLHGAGSRSDAIFVALAADEVVGYSKLGFTEARPGTALNHLTAVRRAWRGRGIAGALKRTQITWAKAQGIERLSTTNELRNEPIRRLNERLGYRPAPGRVILRGPLAST